MCRYFENNNGFSPFFCTANEEVVSILKAMQEYHDKTCIRFRPFAKTDEYWIDIKQDWSGCWSSVGMKKQGQIVNLGSDKCRKHGYVIMPSSYLSIVIIKRVFFLKGYYPRIDACGWLSSSAKCI